MIDLSVLTDAFHAAGIGLSDLFMPLALVVLALMFVAALKKRLGRAGARHATGVTLLAVTPLEISPLLNRSEGGLFGDILCVLSEVRGGHRLFAQVSLGEIVRVPAGGTHRSDRQSVFNMINAKRLDFLVVDREWNPVVALEYHGKGHFRGDALKRDAIKRAACAAAGLPLVEVESGGLTDGQRLDLRRILRPATSLAAE